VIPIGYYEPMMSAAEQQSLQASAEAIKAALSRISLLGKC